MDNPVQGDSTTGGTSGGKRYATLRPRAASLTPTAWREPFKCHRPAAGEGAR
ncbi:DUF6380 family protein [Streptomyces poonensis]|uniref:DUF6380 family protein n=1 Tax=Streptomyces poonensis TaxID=68255 RepID=UPI0035716F51